MRKWKLFKLVLPVCVLLKKYFLSNLNISNQTLQSWETKTLQGKLQFHMWEWWSPVSSKQIETLTLLCSALCTVCSSKKPFCQNSHIVSPSAMSDKQAYYIMQFDSLMGRERGDYDRKEQLGKGLISPWTISWSNWPGSRKVRLRTAPSLLDPGNTGLQKDTWC